MEEYVTDIKEIDSLFANSEKEFMLHIPKEYVISLETLELQLDEIGNKYLTLEITPEKLYERYKCINKHYSQEHNNKYVCIMYVCMYACMFVCMYILSTG